MTAKTATVIKPDGTSTTRTPAGDAWTWEGLRGLIGGGYIEVVRIGQFNVMLVDEDGKPKGLPPNERASAIAGMPIVGTVVLAHKSILTDGRGHKRAGVE